MTVFKYHILATVENHPDIPGVNDRWMDIEIRVYESWRRKGYIAKVLNWPASGVLHCMYRLRGMR
eukprot:3063094-Rhodomonas_salina.1